MHSTRRLQCSRSWTKFSFDFLIFSSRSIFCRPLAHDNQCSMNYFSVTRHGLLYTRRASLAPAFANHHHLRSLLSHPNLISKVVGHLFNYSASQPVTRYQPSDVSNWSENFFAAIGCLFASKYNFHGNPKLYFFIDVYSRAARAPFSPSICCALSFSLWITSIWLWLRRIFVIRRRKKSSVQVLGSYGWSGVNPVAGRVRDGS